MGYQAAVFDLDGTLLNSLADLRDATNHTMAVFGWKPRSDEEIKRFLGNGVEWLLQCAIPGGRNNPRFSEAVALQREYYDRHCLDQTVPYDGIAGMLETLRANGVAAAIVSNKAQTAVTEIRDRFFRDSIAVAIGEAPGIRRKPQPDTVIAAAQQLQVPLSGCVYVGDSEVDIRTAANCGIDCLSVCWGYRSAAELAARGAKVLCASPQETAEAILKGKEDNE